MVMARGGDRGANRGESKACREAVSPGKTWFTVRRGFVRAYKDTRRLRARARVHPGPYLGPIPVAQIYSCAHEIVYRRSR